MGLKERSTERRTRIVVNRAKNFGEAEQWDLEYWQSLSPEERLSALVALHQDLEAIEKGKEHNHKKAKSKRSR